jgi:hypothetical protein
MDHEIIWIGIKRKGDWTVKDAHDINGHDLIGVTCDGDLRAVVQPDESTARDKIEHPAGAEPFYPLRDGEFDDHDYPGIQLVRKHICACGFPLGQLVPPVSGQA